MKKLIYLCLVAIAFSLNSCGEKKEEKKETSKADLKDVQLASTKDPVCEMNLKETPADTILYKGKIYGFCNTGCKDEFKKDPAHYISE